jgi:hypothetical protein
VSHPNPIYDLGAILNGASNTVLNKIKSRQMKIAGGGSTKLKFVENT